MLRLSQITKRYDHKSVVSKIDLQLDAGKTYALIGPSGCGKSTLLRMMIGLIPADDGQILLDGRQLGEVNMRSARANFGYVIQSGGLFPHLTARQNACLPARYRKWPNDKTDSRLEDLRELTQLPSDALERYPAQLSGGQRQRVSLMRALMLDPDILLLDEPLAALDPMIRSQLQTELRTIFRRLGKTVVLVTHDLHEAAYFADQIILMNEGTIAQQGTVGDLVNQPASEFVTQFIEAQQSHRVTAQGDAQ